jgi:peptide/nickel transport system permease protein
MVTAVVAPSPDRGLSKQLSRSWQNLLTKNIALGICLFWLTVVVVCAVTASWLPIQSPKALDPINRLQGPSGAHLLGTDQLGRDVLSRAIYGARVSLIVAIVSFAVGVVIGGSAGVIAGFLRGKVEAVIMWIVDVLLSFPALVLLIALVAYLGRSLTNVSLVLGFLSIPVYARLARAQTLSVSNSEFVLASLATGARKSRTLWREITPNVVPSILAYGFIAMSLTIVVEGTLSFLGLSVAAPTPSWGGIIADGQQYLSEAPYLVLIPSAILCVTVLSLNISGEILRRRYESHGG